MTTKEYLKVIDEVIEKGKYKDNWKSLCDKKTPTWYRNGKFGIFIHWGIYSVPGYGNEWYPRNMYREGSVEYNHHVENYGKLTEFGYKDFIPMFNGENFDAEKWAKLFKKAGAKFVMPVAEHHDGFAMYDTEFNPWNAKNMGPKRDVIEELKNAVEKEDMTFCASTHRAEHYFFLNGGKTIDSDIKRGEAADFYGPAVAEECFLEPNMTGTCDNVYAEGATAEYLEDWMCRTCEIVDKFRPKILYFDWWIQNHSFKPYLKKIAAYYYNRAIEWGEEVTIDFKHNAFPIKAATLDIERGALSEINPIPWQTDTAIGKLSWGYRKDNSYKSDYEIITVLTDVVSKNGMLLLNVGPKSDGTITDEETAVLLSVGKWLQINGEGIYETTPWRFFSEGSVKAKSGMFSEGEVPYTSEDYRFTYKDGCIYAFWMRPSKESSPLIKSLRTNKDGMFIECVELLGKGKVDFKVDKEGLRIDMSGIDISELPMCFKIIMG